MVIQITNHWMSPDKLIAMIARNKTKDNAKQINLVVKTASSMWYIICSMEGKTQKMSMAPKTCSQVKLAYVHSADFPNQNAAKHRRWYLARIRRQA